LGYLRQIPCYFMTLFSGLKLPKNIHFHAIIIIIFLVPLHLFAQVNFKLEVTIHVFHAKKKIEGATVSLLKNGIEEKNIRTDKLGRAFLVLVPNNEYLIKISKAGHITKSIYMNTNGVPEGYNDNPVFKTAPEVELFTSREDFDDSVFEQPIGKLIFDPVSKDFAYDFDYTRLMQAKIVNANKDYEQKIKEKAIYEEKYKVLVANAGQALASKDYANAESAYSEALIYKPNDVFATEKIAEIRAILLAMEEARRKAIAEEEAKRKAEEELEAKRLAADASKRKKYQKFINKGEEALLAGDYENAKLNFTEALALFKQEQLPAEKLRDIERILVEKERNSLAENDKEKQLSDKYESLIKRGDKSFAAGDYNTAKTVFSEAVALMPKETYPKEKLKEIEKQFANYSKPATEQKKEEKLSEAYISELAKKYPQGLTEESYQQEGAKITRRVVVKGTDAFEYKKIAYSWGIYYTKNGEQVSEHVWNTESKVGK
jgi:hypothetical protein